MGHMRSRDHPAAVHPSSGPLRLGLPVSAEHSGPLSSTVGEARDVRASVGVVGSSGSRALVKGVMLPTSHAAFRWPQELYSDPFEAIP